MISRWCSGPCDGDLFLLVGFLGSFVELMPLTSGVFIVKSGSGDVEATGNDHRFFWWVLLASFAIRAN